jgi:optic atrophy protein 1
MLELTRYIPRADSVQTRVCLLVARRLERNIKDVLDQIGDDKNRLQQLLTGKRVLLAEELSE